MCQICPFSSIIKADDICNHSCVTQDITTAIKQTPCVTFHHSTVARSLKVQCVLCFMNVSQTSGLQKMSVVDWLSRSSLFLKCGLSFWRWKLFSQLHWLWNASSCVTLKTQPSPLCWLILCSFFLKLFNFIHLSPCQDFYLNAAMWMSAGFICV